MVEISRQKNAVVVKIIEDQMQMYVIPQFKTAVNAVVAEQPSHLIFDMSDVAHMDSSAMGAIFHFQRITREYGGKISLIHVSHKIMQVFKITKSDAHLDVYESLEQALKAAS